MTGVFSWTPEIAVLFAVVIPLIGTAGIFAARSRPNLRETVTMITAAALFACVLYVAKSVFAGARPDVTLIQPLPGLALRFTVEPLGMLFALVASGLWIVNSIYSIGYMRGNSERNQTRFYAFFALALASTIGLAFSGNLLTMFVFYELLTLSTYPLVTHAGTEAAVKAGRTYLGILISTSIGFFMLAIIWTWVATGRMDFAEGGILAGTPAAPLTAVLLFLYMYGIGKAALMPMHRWLPAAMVAPTPVSALLHAVAVVKAGVFSVVKVIVYIFGIEHLSASGAGEWLVYVAGFTILVASIIALRADNLKRRLAYSTVSQLSYVVLAAAILAPLSVVGAVLHIAAHALGKITLFFAAGSIYTASKKINVSQLGGIGRRMPWTMAAFGIASLSMIGLPPTAGFISKWYIVLGAVDAQHYLALAVIFLSTLLNAGYFLPIVYRAFFAAPPDAATLGETAKADHGEAPWPVVLALTLTAAGTILLFIFPGPALTLAQLVIGNAP